MKTKFLLSMLLGGTMLTACSVDDDLNPAKVAGEVNPSAPVFTVSFDGDDNPLTRAIWNPGGHNVSFESSDVMSLFHGATEDLMGYGNAIYQGNEPKEGKPIDFSTQAMVQQGYAIMVFPADTTFVNKTPASAAPVITLNNVQDEDVLKTIPYISEVLNIPTWENATGKEETSQTAGYGRKYNIALRQMAGILDVQMVVDGDKTIEGVDNPVVFEGITLNSEVENFFTTSVQVKAIEGTHSKEEGHGIWEKNSDLDLATATGEKSLSTSYINQETDMATFAVLPTNATFTESTDELDQVSTVRVSTNYGYINIAVDDKNWYTSDPENPSTTTEILSKMLAPTEKDEKPAIWGDYAEESSMWKGENVGRRLMAYLKVSLSDLEMDGKHIKSSKDLETALKVYRALKIADKKDSEVTLYLDGESDTNPEFLINLSDETLALIEELVDNKKLKLVPCDETTKTDPDCQTKVACTKVTLKNGTTPAEVPGLLFGGAVPVQLDGVWTYTEEKDNEGNIVPKAFENVTKLVVLKTGTLALQGAISADVDETNADDFILENKGQVNVATSAELRINTENHGTINVANTSASLTVNGNTTLENKEAEFEKGDWAEHWKECGTINNYGTLAVDITTGGETNAINNYGVINILDNDAITLVTNNADDNATTANEFGDKNRIGSIVLCNQNSKTTSVGDGETNQGFIKWTVDNGASVTATGIANYVVVDKSWSSEEISSLNSNVKYLEIQKNIELSTDGKEFEAIVIAENATVSVPSGTSITLDDALYLKGKLVFSGTLVEGNKTVGGSKNAGVWRDNKDVYFGQTTGSILSTGGRIE